MRNPHTFENGEISQAAERQDYDEVRRLLKRVKNPTLAKEDIQRALLLSAARDDVKIGYELIKYGADVNYCAHKQRELDRTRPPIFNAVETGSVRLLDLLLSRGADPNVFESDGETPLVAACYHCKPDALEKIIALLIACGADPLLESPNRDSFKDVRMQQERGFAIHIDEQMRFERVWKEKWESVVDLGDGYVLYSVDGRYGIRKGYKILVPPYFTKTHFNFVLGADYLFVSDKMSGIIDEVVFLHASNLSKEKLIQIQEGYSSAAQIWYFDEGIQFIRVVGSIEKPIIRIFNNGMYYLYDTNQNTILSNGYSMISYYGDQTYHFSLGDAKGKLDRLGNEINFTLD